MRAPIAIGLDAAQAESERAARGPATISQDAHLRPQAAFQDDIEVAVVVDVRHREGARVVGEIESADTGEIVVSRRTAIGRLHALIEHIGLPAAPTVVFADELVKRVPAIFVCRRRRRRGRRFGHHLAPEEALQIAIRSIGEHACGDV
jgi:hypothetical protein